jgi:hypothetical protein
MKLDKYQLRNIIVSELHEAAKETMASVATAASGDCGSALATALGNNDDVVALWLGKVQDLRRDPETSHLVNNPGHLDLLLRDAIKETFSSGELDDMALDIAVKAVKQAIKNPQMDTAKLSGETDKTVIINPGGSPG